MLRISPSEAAAKAQTSTANLSRWMDGSVEPKIGPAANLAAALGISVGWLVAGQGPRWAAQVAAEPDAEELRRLAMLEAADLLTQKAVAIATGQAEPVAEEGAEPLGPAIPRTPEELARHQAEVIRAEAGARRRRPTE